MDWVTEEHPKTSYQKGKVRLAFEQMIFSEMEECVCDDCSFAGLLRTDCKSSFLSGRDTRSDRGRQMAFFIGNMKVPREYVYLPDAAVMIVELARQDQHMVKLEYSRGGYYFRS